MKKITKKLQISSEVVRVLNPEQFSFVHGGVGTGTPTVTCPIPSVGCGSLQCTMIDGTCWPDLV
jgi:hypothetical protein